MDPNKLYDFIIIAPNGSEMPMRSTLGAIAEVAKSNPAYKYRLSADAAKNIGGLYYSESKGELIAMADMDIRYLFNAIRKKVRDAVNGMCADLDGMRMVVDNAYCLNDGEFIGLMNELKKRHPELFRVVGK